jgi:hypothetical protein
MPNISDISSLRKKGLRRISIGFVLRFLDDCKPEPRAVQSILSEPGSAANRQAFASHYDLAFPRELHDPQIRRVGF